MDGLIYSKSALYHQMVGRYFKGRTEGRDDEDPDAPGSSGVVDPRGTNLWRFDGRLARFFSPRSASP